MYTIIVGGGQVGTYLASLLLAEKHQIMVIENNLDKLTTLKQSISAERVIQGSGSRGFLVKAAHAIAIGGKNGR
jgi:trk system potassium uptake protein TrkA